MLFRLFDHHTAVDALIGRLEAAGFRYVGGPDTDTPYDTEPALTFRTRWHPQHTYCVVTRRHWDSDGMKLYDTDVALLVDDQVILQIDLSRWEPAPGPLAMQVVDALVDAAHQAKRSP